MPTDKCVKHLSIGKGTAHGRRGGRPVSSDLHMATLASALWSLLSSRGASLAEPLSSVATVRSEWYKVFLYMVL